MESYTTILNKASFEYEDRKSVFIATAMPVSTESEALAFLASIKKEYPDARHHVYAYVLRENSIMRFSDDREPQGTAGMPVLDIIRKNGCTDVAIVVIRYFGGTLLGTGGLVRAYSGSALGALKAGNIITYDVYAEMKISVSYSDYQRVVPYLADKEFRTEDVIYGENVEILGSVKKDKAEDILKGITEITSGRGISHITSEKFSY